MKRYRIPIAIIAVILVIFALPQVTLVPYIAKQLEREIQESLHAREVQVHLRALWGWGLLVGRLPSLEFTAHDAVIDGLEVSSVELRGEEVRFDPRALWQKQEFVYTEPLNVEGKLTVTENALNELLWEVVDPDRLLSLQVVPEGIDLAGTISFWNVGWKVTVRGDLEVHHGTALRYVLKNVALSDASLPPVLLDVLRENYEFIIDFGAFPYTVELRDVFLEERQILITFGGQL